MTKASENKKLYDILRKVKIFQHVPQNVIEGMAGKMSITDFKKNEAVFKKGDIGDCIYVIISGNVKLHEQEMTIAEMTAGDFFGEFSLLDNEPRSLSVTCTEPSMLAALYQKDFYMVLKEHPESIKDIIEALIKRIREQNNKIFAYLKNREKELEAEVNKKTYDLQTNNAELSFMVEKLKQTQQQLVMKETLASLGQLTAGIAHTLKNPLNFVNNFSLISSDLITEASRTNNENERNELLQNLKINIEKIHQHGIRANTIVENMLQHSASGTSEKQLVNLNELTDEIASIALHTYKSNNHGFECEILKEYAADIPSVNASTKEISRVILNLLNNAFYAVDKKKKMNSIDSSYTPTVKVTTYLENNTAIISIADNGAGIPLEIREKIFEPFFTTKPSGQANGLGLSMSNEIVKMYGGEVKLNNESRTGAEFQIFIPI